jgi:hypothetical protein
MEAKFHPLLSSVLDVGKWSDSRNSRFIATELLMLAEKEVPWAPERFWTFWGKEKYHNPAGNQTMIPQFSSPCLHITTNELSRQRLVDKKISKFEYNCDSTWNYFLFYNLNLFYKREATGRHSMSFGVQINRHSMSFGIQINNYLGQPTVLVLALLQKPVLLHHCRKTSNFAIFSRWRKFRDNQLHWTNITQMIQPFMFTAYQIINNIKINTPNCAHAGSGTVKTNSSILCRSSAIPFR